MLGISQRKDSRWQASIPSGMPGQMTECFADTSALSLQKFSRVRKPLLFEGAINAYNLMCFLHDPALSDSPPSAFSQVLLLWYILSGTQNSPKSFPFIPEIQTFHVLEAIKGDGDTLFCWRSHWGFPNQQSKWSFLLPGTGVFLRWSMALVGSMISPSGRCFMRCFNYFSHCWDNTWEKSAYRRKGLFGLPVLGDTVLHSLKWWWQECEETGHIMFSGSNQATV